MHLQKEPSICSSLGGGRHLANILDGWLEVKVGGEWGLLPFLLLYGCAVGSSSPVQLKFSTLFFPMLLSLGEGDLKGSIL